MPNRKQAHSVAPKGKKVLVRLKNGETFVDKFREKDKGKIYFDEHIIKLADLQMMTIYRETATNYKAIEPLPSEIKTHLSKAKQKQVLSEIKQMRTQSRKTDT